MQENPTGTGYRVTYQDFVALLTDPAWRPSIGPMIEKWFGCALTVKDGLPRLTNAYGEHLGVADVHQEIQSDKQKQYDLYQAAMDLWR